jgi:hypothetical protein
MSLIGKQPLRVVRMKVFAPLTIDASDTDAFAKVGAISII